MCYSKDSARSCLIVPKDRDSSCCQPGINRLERVSNFLYVTPLINAVPHVWLTCGWRRRRDSNIKAASNKSCSWYNIPLMQWCVFIPTNPPKRSSVDFSSDFRLTIGFINNYECSNGDGHMTNLIRWSHDQSNLFFRCRYNITDIVLVSSLFALQFVHSLHFNGNQNTKYYDIKMK